MRKVIYLVLLVIALFLSLQLKNWVDTTVVPHDQEPVATTTPDMTTIMGTFTCLPHKGDGPSTMECAFGLKSIDGSYYALDWSDSPHSAFDLPMDRQYLVTGLLLPIEAMSSNSFSNYDIKGVMKVSSYAEVKKDIPVVGADSPIVLELKKPIIVGDVKVTVNSVLEDSRCPIDVMCIQAGRAVLALSLETSETSTSTKIEIGQTVSIKNPNLEMINFTLDSVEPAKKSTQTVQDTDYRFTFKVQVLPTR